MVMQSDFSETCETTNNNNNNDSIITRRFQIVQPNKIQFPAAVTMGPSVLNNLPGSHSGHCHNLTFEFNLEDHVKRTRKAANYLKQIYHSRDCNGKCQSIACRKVSTILPHVTECKESNCSVPGCNTTKSLLLHSQECSNSPFSTKAAATAAIVSTTSNQVCLLCTIALSGYSSVPQITSFSTDNIDHYNNTAVSSEDDIIYEPLIHDEIISYNRIPFQEFSSRESSPLKTPVEISSHLNIREDEAIDRFVPRAKTFSDSDFVVSSAVSAHGTNAIVHEMQPMKKMRSKSLNVPYTGTPLYL